LAVRELVAAYPTPAPPASATTATPATAIGRLGRQRCQRGGSALIMSGPNSSSGWKSLPSGPS
jgi:hypothetical protein